MIKLKYIFPFFLCFLTLHSAEALDINYATIIGKNTSSILVEYSSIGKKKNYLCTVSTLACTQTKKTTLTASPSYVLPADITSGLYDIHANHITPSSAGSYVAYYISGTDANPMRTFSIENVKDRTIAVLSSSVSYWDLVADEGRVFSFSPDEKQVTYLDDRDGTMALYLVDTSTLASGQITSSKLATSAFQVDDFLFADSNTIYYIGNGKENPYVWSLYRYDIKNKKNFVIDTNVSYTDSLIKVGNNIIYNSLQSSGFSPKTYNTSTKKVRQFKTPYTGTNTIIKNQEIVSFGTSHGVLMKPKVKKDAIYPLIIWLHGGPYRQTSYGYHPYHSYGIYDSILELLRKDNAVVLKLDYRGSFGFGRPYAEGIKGSVGSGDVTDVMDAIAYAKSRYNVSDVYLIGNSYGGYLSLRALVEHPDAFTGVISINGVTNWETLVNSIQTSIFNTQFNGLPNASNRALYDMASIEDRIPTIGNQKIAIIAGQSDRTIPYWQATNLYDKLKAANKNVSLVSYEGEDHVYKTKKTINNLCKQIFTFVKLPVDSSCSK